jgi:hypothetical protein
MGAIEGSTYESSKLFYGQKTPSLAASFQCKIPVVDNVMSTICTAAAFHTASVKPHPSESIQPFELLVYVIDPNLQP